MILGQGRAALESEKRQMKLSNILANIKGTDTEKTASASTTPANPGKTAAAPSTTGDKLKQALKEATAAPAEMKTAAAPSSPVGDLTKIASQIAGAEHEALVKEAHLYGSAVADGFLARVAQHTDAVEKIAAVQPQSTKTAADGSFEKFAADNPALVKEAAELGYASTMGQMEKLAEAAYTTGYNGAVETIYKLANASFVQGFEDSAQLISELRK
jgi:hypothetical protein